MFTAGHFLLDFSWGLNRMLTAGTIWLFTWPFPTAHFEPSIGVEAFQAWRVGRPGGRGKRETAGVS